MDTLLKLRQEMATTLNVPVESIDESTAAGVLPAWDSLGHVNLMMSIEQAFDLQLDVEDFPRLTSVKAIMEYLRGQGIA